MPLEGRGDALGTSNRPAARAAAICSGLPPRTAIGRMPWGAQQAQQRLEVDRLGLFAQPRQVERDRVLVELRVGGAGGEPLGKLRGVGGRRGPRRPS
jgi:hypothetical protein